LDKTYPALEIRFADLRLDADLLYAALDDFSPVAIEERDRVNRVFFATASARDRALRSLSSRFEMSPIDVPGGDWGRRSQQNLRPVTVGRVTLLPDPGQLNPEPRIPNSGSITVVIQPSMGFGTGHHATTRLCLLALQAFDLTGRTVLDVGTGSGVLAIVAERLGARSATGLDIDPDAVQAARDNLRLNSPPARPDGSPRGPQAGAVTFMVGDLAAARLAAAESGGRSSDAGPSAAGDPAGWDVVTANLTGALLLRSAPMLAATTRPGGLMIVSGLLHDERDEVFRALMSSLWEQRLPEPVVEWERQEEEWVGLAFRKPSASHETA
jgi:ribosomal protein L11 methyltransferase